ncbi:MAG: ATP-binding protein [Candidatus Obscuribacterales bacterium]|nr:ATP-binding protein [Candidatus Obscuribacterales bacterium]
MTKLTITGASGVGKTTLAKQLAADLNLPMVPELAREICTQMGYERIGMIPDQEGFKRQVLEAQFDAERKHPSFIADRSAIDAWVLWQRWNICSAMTYDSESFYEKVLEHSKTYSHIVYIPPMIEPEEDEFRWTEPDYIKQIDRYTRMTLFDLKLWDKVLTVKADTPEQRVAEVKAWLSMP